MVRTAGARRSPRCRGHPPPLQAVRTANVPDEERVTGEDADWTVGVGGIGDHEREMLWRVAGGMEHIGANVADHEAVAVVEQNNAARVREVIRPLRPPCLTEIDERAGRGGKLARTADVIGVDVGLGDVGNFETFAPGGLDVNGNITHRINHERFTAGGAAHQIRGLRQLVVIEIA